MDIAGLDSLVRFYFNQALAPSTQHTYHSAQSRYIAHCRAHSITPLPATITSLCSFVVSLAARGVSHKYIKTYLSGIRHYQISAIGLDPGISSMVLLSYVLQGVKRYQATSGSMRPRTRLPITATLMCFLLRQWNSQGVTFNNTMLWAACYTCFFGFLRSGEATVPSRSSYDPAVHLSITDISLDSAEDPRTVVVHIKASKTDPFRTGVHIFLGKTSMELCPMSACSRTPR